MSFKIKAVAAAVGTAWALSSLVAPASALETVTYGIASNSLDFAALYIAQEAGFLEKRGIELKPEFMAGSAVLATATIAGNLPFYVGLPQAAAPAIAKGQKLNTFAKINQEYLMDVVVSKAVAERLHLSDSMPVEKRLEALKGLKIAVWTPGGAAEMLSRVIAKNIGLDTQRDMTLLPIGPAGPMIAALENDRIDAFIQSAPSSDEAVHRLGAYKLYTGAKGEWEPLKDEVFDCLIGNPDWLAKHQSQAVAIYQALNDAMNYMRTEPEASKAMLRKKLNMFSAEDFEAAYDDLHYIIPPSPAVGDVQAKQVYNFWKALDPSFNVTLNELVDPTISEAASH